MFFLHFLQCCVSGETQTDTEEICDEEGQQEENDHEETGTTATQHGLQQPLLLSLSFLRFNKSSLRGTF